MLEVPFHLSSFNHDIIRQEKKNKIASETGPPVYVDRWLLLSLHRILGSNQNPGKEKEARIILIPVTPPLHILQHTRTVFQINQ